MLTTRVISAGPEARFFMQGTGQMLSVTRSALFLSRPEGYVLAVVGENSPDGPLTLRVRDLGLVRASVSQGDRVCSQGCALEIGDRVRMEVSPDADWQPVMPSLSAPSEKIQEAAFALARVIAEASTYMSRPSLGPVAVRIVTCEKQLALPGSFSDPVQAAAAPHIARLYLSARAGDTMSALSAAGHLLGLGYGLTPSGDDFLAGFAACCAWVTPANPYASWLIKQFAHALMPTAHQRTGLISARLLHYAMSGLLYGPALQLGRALLAGQSDRIVGAAHALFQVGATSGIDTSAGILLGMLSMAAGQGEQLSMPGQVA